MRSLLIPNTCARSPRLAPSRPAPLRGTEPGPTAARGGMLQRSHATARTHRTHTAASRSCTHTRPAHAARAHACRQEAGGQHTRAGTCAYDAPPSLSLAAAGASTVNSVPMTLSAGQLALQNSKKEKQGYDVFVRNLLEDTKTEELYAFFEPAGKIIRAPRLNLGRGFAWITFDSLAAVAQAVSWSGSYLGSRIVYVHAANNVSGGDGHEKIHHPALCDETVEKMIAPNPGGVYVDGTFGRGGHTKAMLAAMSPTGKMHAFDMDPEAIRVGKQLTTPLGIRPQPRTVAASHSPSHTSATTSASHLHLHLHLTFTSTTSTSPSRQGAHGSRPALHHPLRAVQHDG